MGEGKAGSSKSISRIANCEAPEPIAVMRKRQTPLYQGVAFGCSIAIIHMLLHSTVDFSLQSPAIALLFLTILSMSVIVTHLATGHKKSRYKNGSSSL